jgi:two-component system, cell cycle response regulator DivK
VKLVEPGVDIPSPCRYAELKGGQAKRQRGRRPARLPGDPSGRQAQGTTLTGLRLGWHRPCLSPFLEAATSPVRTRPLVLVIDDSSDALEVYDIALTLEGLAVESASDGQEGFRKALDLQPDLIITDLAMPIMNGWETIRRLRADDRTCRIPIIACSDRADPPQAQDAWVDATLTKPCPLEKLLQEARAVLRRSSAA